MIASSADTCDARAIRDAVDWLATIAQRRDLTIEAPGGPHDAALLELLDALCPEFSNYRDVVAGARQAASGNLAYLAAIVRSATDQDALIRLAAGAAVESERSAAVMAQAAQDLGGSTRSADTAAREAGAKLAAIGAVLSALADGLGACDAPLSEMVTLTAQIAGFPQTLARLSRHAQLLGVNASIEAAHLAEAGARFEIVASEVRKLSTSTATSKADVARIIGELQASTAQVARAMRESHEATAGASREISGARDSVEHISAGIGRLEEKVTIVVDVAGIQNMALAAIGTSVGEIAEAANSAARATRDASKIDLEALLSRAAERAARWRVHASRPRPTGDADPFGAWIAGIARGADPAERAAIDDDVPLAPLVAAVRALIEQINTDQREILVDVVNVALAVAQNTYAWVAIDAAQGNIDTELATVRETVAGVVESASTSAQISMEMRDVVDDIRRQYDAVLQLLDDALTLVARIGTSVGGIVGFVESMTSAAARADAIMELIETLSSETDLLSLNAAIESAHAGELGLGFGVIAEEIRALAGATNESTTRVAKLVSTIADVSGTLQASIAAAGTHTTQIIDDAAEARLAIGSLQTAFAAAENRARDVEANAAAQSRALEGVRDTIGRSNAATGERSAGDAAKFRLELVTVGASAHAIAGRRPIGTVAARARARLEPLCAQVESILESAIAAGRVSLERLCDLTYTPIEGAAIASLGRLFDVSRVPAGGFSPPKFATPWDAAVDEPIIEALSDAWPGLLADSFGAVAMVLSDLNGFLWAYPRMQVTGWTGDPSRDNAGNRIKRMFEDEYSLRTARTGLGAGSAQVGARASYEAFRSAGCDLAQGPQRLWGVTVYARDTTAVCTDLALAVYAHGRRLFTLRFIYDPNVV